MIQEGLCKCLEWDSEFFGRKIARVTDGLLNRGSVEGIIKWCLSKRIECLYFLADVTDKETTHLAEKHGFRLVDVRVMFERRIDASPPPVGAEVTARVRTWSSQDMPNLRAIARMSHRDSRFHYDPYFPSSCCDALYETWIEKSCYGYADTVLVADLCGKAVGYITCKVLHQGDGLIGLCAVEASHRGKGLGRQLVAESLRWFASRSVQVVTVVTQGRNLQALRLYQRQGFVTRSMRLWYHRWFLANEAEGAR